jgi:hypothetical protein
MNNIKHVRIELKKWGNYQARQEVGSGYSNKSNVEQLRLSLLAGGVFGGGGAESDIPDHLTWIDNQIQKLNKMCIKAIRFKYVRKEKIENVKCFGFDSKNTYEYWLRTAEKALLSD